MVFSFLLSLLTHNLNWFTSPSKKTSNLKAIEVVMIRTDSNHTSKWERNASAGLDMFMCRIVSHSSARRVGFDIFLHWAVNSESMRLRMFITQETSDCLIVCLLASLVKSVFWFASHLTLYFFLYLLSEIKSSNYDIYSLHSFISINSSLHSSTYCTRFSTLTTTNAERCYLLKCTTRNALKSRTEEIFKFGSTVFK